MPDDERPDEENGGGGIAELPVFSTKRMLQMDLPPGVKVTEDTAKRMDWTFTIEDR